MAESTLKFSNLSKDNEKIEHVEGLCQPSAIFMNIDEKQFKPDVNQSADNYVYDRPQLRYQNIEESVNYLKCQQSTDVPQQIRFIIDNFEPLKPEILNELAEIYQKFSIVMLFMDVNYEKFLVYWKLADMNYFLELKAFEHIPGLDYKDFYEYVGDFLLSMLRFNHIGVFTAHSINNNKIDINDLADTHNCNLFQNAADDNKIEVVKIIIKHSKMRLAKDLIDNPLSPQALADHKGHLEVLMLLLHANYSYPLYMTTNSDEFISFKKVGQEMHSAIMSRNKKEIMRILSAYPKQKHYYNEYNVSALKASLDIKSIDIYKLLFKNGIEFGPHEDNFDHLTPKERIQLTDFHFKHTQDLPDNHINILMMNTTICHDEANKDNKQHYIKKAYETLNNIPSIKVILEAVAASKKVKIVFDFKRSSVHMIDLESNKDTNGVCYVDGKICIGAKQLLDPSTEHETFGTLAHELCHYALQLTYGNASKPYKEKDNEQYKKFVAVYEDCKARMEHEELIRMVYKKYEQDQRHAELAVRPPHLIAQYYNKPDKLKAVQDEYREMFSYYENHIVPDMMEALPMIREKAEELTVDQIIFISFIISLIFIGLISMLLYFKFYTPHYSYPDLSAHDQFKVRNAVVRYKDVDVNLWTLYPNDTTIYDNLTSEHITRILNNHKLDLSHDYLAYMTSSIYFSWTNLTKPLKDKIINSNMTYQNQNIKFKDIHAVYPHTFDSLTSDDIISILDGLTTFSIGHINEMSVKFYMKRNFMPENSIYAYLKYAKVAKASNLTFKAYYESSNLSWEPKTSLTSVLDNVVERTRENHAISMLINITDVHKTINDIINDTEQSRLFILSSEAGAGKTITFEHLTMKLKHLYPKRWVSYVDLRKHRDMYDDKELLDGVEGFLEKVLDLKVKSEFERELFRSSYRSDQVMLLWNGYDEISPNYSNFVLKLLKDIHQSTKNIQYICTRPLFSNDLSRHLGTTSYMLVPLNHHEQHVYFQLYLNSKNVSDTATINQRIANFFNMTKRLVQVPFRNFDTPLVLSMFADLSDDQINACNLYDLISKFIQKKTKILTDKNITSDKSFYKVPPNSNFNVYRIYQSFAFKYDIFPIALYTSPFTQRLHIINTDYNSRHFFDISRAGILFINEVTTFDFAHKTYAEFFIAQYLIDNLYNLGDSISNYDEIDSRIEMFFIFIQYSVSFNNVMELVMDYVQNSDVTDKFDPQVTDLLTKKYKKHMIYILNKPYKHNFRFFFEFFKRDKELMLDMLKVNENETFYTALFNPFYGAAHLDPNDIKNTVRNYLTDDEFDRFTNGQHQMGVLLYGMYDRHEYDKLDDYNLTISNGTEFWDFYDMIKVNLTIDELKQLFLNPVVTILYRKHCATVGTNQKFWMEVEQLFDRHEMSIFLGNLFPQIFRPNLNISAVAEHQALNMLITKTEQLLTSPEIYKLASDTYLLFRCARSYPQLQIVWNFLASHTTRAERQELLKYDYRKNPSPDNQQFYSMYYKFFVMTPRVLHVNLFADNFTASIDFVESIYGQTFDKADIQAFFNESNNFLFSFIFERPIEVCEKVASYLERLFGDGSEDVLLKLIERTFNGSKLTIFEYFDKILSFGFKENENIKKKLKIFSDLRNRLRKGRKGLV
ncbi:uncharacterized protein [Chironomus tepperi]|uniref:uncharacterized protein n=1 Tax=Chironomus tepperi TaxID=113505 RepID=UPI00391FB87B